MKTKTNYKNIYILFSGGKDSVFTLEWAQKHYPDSSIHLIIGVNAHGETQLLDSPDTEPGLQNAIIANYSFEKHFVTTSEDGFESEITAAVLDLTTKDDLLITGDIFNSIDPVYELLPHRTVVCPAKEAILLSSKRDYLQSMIQDNFEIIISSITQGQCPISFLGRIIDDVCISELESMGIDILGDNGEFQTLVLNCPSTNNRISIDSFSTITTRGRDHLGLYYTRIANVVFSIHNKYE